MQRGEQQPAEPAVLHLLGLVDAELSKAVLDLVPLLNRERGEPYCPFPTAVASL